MELLWKFILLLSSLVCAAGKLPTNTHTQAHTPPLQICTSHLVSSGAMNCYLGGGGGWGEQLTSSVKSTVVTMKQTSSPGQKAATIFRGQHLQVGSKVPPAALFRLRSQSIRSRRWMANFSTRCFGHSWWSLWCLHEMKLGGNKETLRKSKSATAGVIDERSLHFLLKITRCCSIFMTAGKVTFLINHTHFAFLTNHTIVIKHQMRGNYTIGLVTHTADVKNMVQSNSAQCYSVLYRSMLGFSGPLIILKSLKATKHTLCKCS